MLSFGREGSRQRRRVGSAVSVWRSVVRMFFVCLFATCRIEEGRRKEGASLWAERRVAAGSGTRGESRIGCRGGGKRLVSIA